MKFSNLINLQSVAEFKSELPEPSAEMVEWYESRTKRHIELVQKYAKKIEDLAPEYKGLVEQASVHDQSKWEEPERSPYIFISWQYRCKDLGREFSAPEGLKDLMNKATLHHVTHNSHHPEFHAPKCGEMINRENRDKPPKEMVDATKMPDLDLAEMIADWSAMSEEKGGSTKGWADKNVNVRWKFTEEQSKEIYRLIGLLEKA